VSENTSADLRLAELALTHAEIEADLAKQELLNEVASRLTGEVDRMGYGIAHEEPAVTMALGEAGVRRLRAELAAAEGRLLREIRGATQAIKWPQSCAQLDAPRPVGSALSAYLRGPRLASVTAILTRYGYHLKADDDGARPLVLPGDLCGMAALERVETALRAVAAAREVVAEAQAAVDAAKAGEDWRAVDRLWS
jgi:hypothetical protein